MAGLDGGGWPRAAGIRSFFLLFRSTSHGGRAQLDTRTLSLTLTERPARARSPWGGDWLPPGLVRAGGGGASLNGLVLPVSERKKKKNGEKRGSEVGPLPLPSTQTRKKVALSHPPPLDPPKNPHTRTTTPTTPTCWCRPRAWAPPRTGVARPCARPCRGARCGGRRQRALRARARANELNKPPAPTS
jgi:hypothetical protein